MCKWDILFIKSSYLYYVGIKFFIYIYPFNPKGWAEVGVAVESRGRRTGDDLCKAGCGGGQWWGASGSGGPSPDPSSFSILKLTDSE